MATTFEELCEVVDPTIQTLTGLGYGTEIVADKFFNIEYVITRDGKVVMTTTELLAVAAFAAVARMQATFPN